jgi:hypothetical protein
MRASKKPFQYPSLNSAASEIRLINLEPSQDPSADIQCWAFNTSLKKHPEYEALSYVWGDSINTRLIKFGVCESSEPNNTHTLSFSPLAVTVNLEQALRSLRYAEKPRTLWVDAVCIDQSNLEERNQQIHLMSRTYQQCVHDLLWLGSEDVQIGRAMNLLQRLQGRSEHTRAQLMRNGLDHEEITFSSFSEDDWNDFEMLLLRCDIWNRVWIIQELIFSPKILLVCGKYTMDWECLTSVMEENAEFRQAFDVQGLLSTRILTNFTKISPIHTHRLPEELTAGIFDKSLLSVVLWFFSWDATDRRDKVYAVLNLTKDGKGFPVDYKKKTLNDVAFDFAKACIEGSGNLKILYHSTAHAPDISKYLPRDSEPSSEGPITAKNRSLSTLIPYLSGFWQRRATKKAKLPTWLPDLSKHWSSSSGLAAAGATRYNACGTHSHSSCTISPISLRLTAQGIFIDTISVLNTISLRLPDETSRDRWVRDVLSWAPPNLNCLTRYAWTSSHGESNLTAYWRTLTTDRRADKRLSADDFNHVNWYLEIREGRVIPEELLVLIGWRFGLTAQNFYCMFPPQAQEGDVVVILYGAEIPLLLRRNAGKKELYELVGEAYVHGLMDGEAARYADAGLWERSGVCQRREFVIV